MHASNLLKTYIRTCILEVLREQPTSPAPGVVSTTASNATDKDAAAEEKPELTQPTTKQVDKPTNTSMLAGRIKRDLDAQPVIKNDPNLLAVVQDTVLGLIPSLKTQKGKTGTALTTATVQAANKAGRKAAEDAAARDAAVRAASTPTGPGPATEK